MRVCGCDEWTFDTSGGLCVLQETYLMDREGMEGNLRGGWSWWEEDGVGERWRWWEEDGVGERMGVVGGGWSG